MMMGKAEYVATTDDTNVWRRGQSLWQNVGTQKVQEGQCRTQLDAHHVLVSSQTRVHSGQLQRNVCNTRKTKTKKN